ncbi:MAG: leucyl aminopeptidase family protein [Deltaproteobacteria bacterium]|nr:leucyl aminopeptidase family protein [Deltaproteobacteria bacterium]
MTTPTEIRFHASPDALAEHAALVVAGRAARLRDDDVAAILPAAAKELLPAMLESLRPGDGCAATTTWLPGSPPRKLTLVARSEKSSRHNSPGRPDALGAGLAGRDGKGRTGVLIALDDPSHAVAAAVALARAYPSYSLRSSKKKPAPGEERALDVAFVAPGGVAPAEVERAAIVAEAARRAGALVDMPTSELNTTAFVAIAREVAAEVGAEITVIDGAALVEGGFGGLEGVGRAAEHGPALVHLTWAPEGAAGRTVWVGKGIVYDTGGLSLKGKADMPGMKGDMGGAAAVLEAFRAAALLGSKARLDALLCLAENAVGPRSVRPDDVLTMYSGRRVEVNNTDAEGRLVLADGVAYAVKHLAPEVIVDLATLTGAQLIATGRKHAAIVCNDDDLEARAVAAGKASGDLVHPLPYVPEFFREEFKSRVADLKNSVKDRMNAQSSCAAQFIAEHLGDYAGKWLHVDIAGPSTAKERGTGFGVALLLDLIG